MTAREGKEHNEKNEGNNLVMAFPEWRHWESGEMNLDFDEMDDDIDFYLDEKDQVFGSLEEYMNRHKSNAVAKVIGKTSEDQLIDSIENHTREIKKAQARIKFYLEEIEMFLPRRK